jgi:hypothetical protein
MAQRRLWTLVCGVVATLCGSGAAAAERCEQVLEVGGRQVLRAPDGSLVFEAGLAIDADGAPQAYHPAPGLGLDHLANAGKPGNWWALVTDDGSSKGQPVVQGPGDPAPGYYVSATALEDPTRPRADPRRYVDSSTVPYVVLPPQALAPKLEGGPRLGDFALVTNVATGKTSYAIVADVGPAAKLGEGSMALAVALGLPSDPKRCGAAAGVRVVVRPGSGNRRPRTAADIDREAPHAVRDVTCHP